MGGGDAVSVQEVRRKTHRGRKEEGGETVKPGGVGGGVRYGAAAICSERSSCVRVVATSGLTVLLLNGRRCAGGVGNGRNGSWMAVNGAAAERPIPAINNEPRPDLHKIA